MELGWFLSGLTCVPCVRRWKQCRRRGPYSIQVPTQVNDTQTPSPKLELTVTPASTSKSSSTSRSFGFATKTENGYVPVSEQDRSTDGPADAPVETTVTADVDIDATVDAAAVSEQSVEQKVKEEEPDDETWPAWSREVFQGWIPWLRLGAPAMVSVLLEWGSFEAMSTMAGNLGRVPLAVHATYLTTVQLWYRIPLGVAMATAVLVGQALGGERPAEAARTGREAMLVSIIYSVLNGGLFVLVLSASWLRLFSTDQEVIDLGARQMWILWIYGFWDSIKGVLIGVFRGSGRPMITVYVNIVGCLLIGLPLGFALAFHTSLGIVGLWLGISASIAVASVSLFVLMHRTDWTHQVHLAKLRTRS